jgi:hypothetical protein
MISEMTIPVVRLEGPNASLGLVTAAIVAVPDVFIGSEN